MYRRWQKFRTSVSMTRGDTFKVDLPTQGFLSCIYAEMWVQQGAGAPFYNSNLCKWRAIDYLDNVIVRANGRGDIVNVPGRIANYLAYRDQGLPAYDVLREYSAASQVSRLWVNFGRHAFDPLFGLDLSQYDNIEFNLTNSWADTYWQGSPTLTIFLGFLDGPGAPRNTKFFRKELWRKITTVQDGREYLEIPTGLPVRRIIFQADSSIASGTGMYDTEVRNVLYDIKKTFKSGALTPYDGRMMDLMMLELYLDGKLPMTFGANYHAADKGWESGIGDVRGFAAISGARDGAVSSVIPTREGDLSKASQKWEAREGDSPVDWIAMGAAYEHCVSFDYGEFFPETGLLDPSRGGDGIVDLELHTRDSSSAASGTIRVALERLAQASDVG